MRKTLALILVVLILLCMVPASVFADTAEEPDEATAAEFNHKVYEANRLDTLFGRHKSLAYSFVYPEEPGRTWFVWQTSDCAYQEWGTSAAQFDRDRVVYTMNCDEETSAVSVSCGVNIEPDYNPFYNFVGETEEEFFDPAHDHVTRIWEEDGEIHSTSQFDETLSRKFVENELGLKYTGQTIRTEIILDAETYEILKHVETMVQDGEEIAVCVIDVKYDLPEPLACRTLRAPFERNTENAMTVSFIVDAGTDHGFSRALTVPVSTEASLMFGDVPFVYFNDPNDETLAHWDRMSDLNLYVFTNPDEALTAKFQTLYDRVIQEMRSAETFEKLVAASGGDTILSRHENFEMTRTIFRDEEEILTVTNYRDADVDYWGYSDGSAALRRADVWVDREPGAEGFVYVETIFDTPEALEYSFVYSRDSALITIPEQEKLLETKDAGDGRFVAVTESRDSELIRQILAETESVGGYAYVEGMSLRYEYTFDTQSSDLLNIDAFLIDPEGEAHLLLRDTYAYDVNVYDPFAEGEPFAEYEAAATDPELSRTITVVFDPDTDNEHSVEYVLPRAAYFYIFRDGWYVEEIYTDRACAQLFESSDGVSDLELYVK